MIVRESPRSNRKQPNRDLSWPPRSPHDVLLSSPSRQRRLEAVRTRDSASPSPVKHNSHAPSSSAAIDLSDDDDEETLQLKLQQIEAQLKLKRLQKARQENVSPRRTKSVSDLPRAHVEVPVSPTKRAPAAPESPRRVQLGIDKGLKASEVSLKRPAPKQGLYGRAATLPARREPAKPSKSFSERLAEARSCDQSRADNLERHQKSRRHGFGVSDPIKSAAGEFARESGSPTRSKSVSASGRPACFETRKTASDEEPRRDYDTFSKFHLSKRHQANETLRHAFEGKLLYSIPTLLKEVKAPEYEPPNVDRDYVIFGIVASKSTPKAHADAHRLLSSADPDDKANQRSKYMVLKLVDLEWEVDLFLFDTGFDTFWKIPTGSILAILNPAIMPPKPHLRDTGKFSLKLSSSEDTVLEIGTAKDLGWCKSVKKDGQQCGAWVNLTKTEFCDFHVNLRMEKTRATRPEVNSMSGLSLFGKSGRGKGWSKKADKSKEPRGAYHDREAHESAYSVPREHSHGLSAAKLFDADDYVRGESAKDRLARLKKTRENEKRLLKQLKDQGTGMGSEYARRRAGQDDEDIVLQSAAFEKKSQDLASLGLLGRGAAEVRLSPTRGSKTKGRANDEAMGWSGAFKRGLLEPTRGLSPERKQQKRSDSPAKQARFMLPEKGLRMPGRQSLENRDARGPVDEEEDDDGLDIV